MARDPHKIFQKIDTHLESHTNTTLQAVSKKLRIPAQEVEQIISDVKHTSFKELQENKRLSQAFRILSSKRAMTKEWKIERRSRPRIFIPWITVKYLVHDNDSPENNYSSPCPVASFNINGLAFLTDNFLLPGYLVSLLLTLPEEKETLPVKGHIMNSSEIEIASYHYRSGIQFLPFVEEKGCNDLEVLKVLAGFEKSYHVSWLDPIVTE